MLTAKQQQTYQFIRKYFLEYGLAPTEAEIATGIGISSRGVVHRYVTALAEQGLLEITAGRRRNIRLLVDESANDGDGGLPVIGRIAAGQPIEAIDQQKTLNISHQLLGPKRFILEVKGDSMIGDNICNGDYIICEQRDQIGKNDIVIALVDGQEATLKRWQSNDDGSVTLIPSNPRFSPMVYPAERVMIQGVYLGLLRLN